MDSERDVELLGSFWQLHAAIIRRDGLEGRIRTGLLDADLLDRSLSAAEGVLAARTSLYRCLMDLGWTPPAAVVRDVVLDEGLLAEPAGPFAA